MNIIIAGGTGFIGKALVRHFLQNSHHVAVIGRSVEKIKRIFDGRVQPFSWDDFDSTKRDLLYSTDVIINVTGATIGAKRWTLKRKQEILDSRIYTTKILADSCALLGNLSPPLFNAGGVGVYGLQKPVSSVLPPAFSESDSINFDVSTDFLSEVGRATERATHSAIAAAVRVINLRFGVVLDKDGGALSQLKIPFLLGIGGPIGSGQQPFPWVALKDLIQAIDFLISHPNIEGPVNIVAPQCVSQKQFAHSLAKVLNRPCFFKTPAWCLRLLFGELADELLLNGQCVQPRVLLDNGFQFHYPDIDSALSMIFQKK